MKKSTNNFSDWKTTNLDNYNPVQDWVVAVYSCPGMNNQELPPSMPFYPQSIVRYECEICGRILDTPRVICYKCRDRLREIIGIKEN